LKHKKEKYIKAMTSGYDIVLQITKNFLNAIVLLKSVQSKLHGAKQLLKQFQ